MAQITLIFNGQGINLNISIVLAGLSPVGIPTLARGDENGTRWIGTADAAGSGCVIGLNSAPIAVKSRLRPTVPCIGLAASYPWHDPVHYS